MTLTPKPLSPANQNAHRALARCIAAVHALNDKGVRVRSMEWRGPTPVLTIETPPAGAITGVMRKRFTIFGVTSLTLATVVHGCQVEWTERRQNEVREAVHS